MPDNPSETSDVELKTCGPNYRHGHARHGAETPTWVSWQSMLARCRYPERDHEEKHIGRGIQVCERWQSFDNFLTDMKSVVYVMKQRSNRHPGQTSSHIAACLR